MPKVRVKSNIVDLRKLGSAAFIEMAAKALDKPGRAMQTAIRSFVPVDTGALRDSIDYTVRQYPEHGKVVVVVGPKRRFRRGKNNPNKYAHLVEFGHVAVKPVKGSKIRKGTAQKITHVPAHPFMRPGVELYRNFAASDMASELDKGLTTRVNMLKGGRVKQIML